jgi:hypothetical protein
MEIIGFAIGAPEDFTGTAFFSLGFVLTIAVTTMIITNAIKRYHVLIKILSIEHLAKLTYCVIPNEVRNLKLQWEKDFSLWSK